MIAAIYARKHTEPTMTKILAAFVITLFFSGPALADVVELKTGQRVEGTLKQADQATVQIEVGGQTITFNAEQVRAMYYGSAPTARAPEESAAGKAIQAIKAMQSMTTAGVTYRDYGPRVADAKIEVDRYLTSGQNRGPESAGIRNAMDLYAYAGRAWSAKVGSRSTTSSVYQAIASDPAVALCAPLKTELEDTARTTPQLGDALGRRLIIAERVSVLWSCAAAQLAEAEKLLTEKK